jgi:hypothetical protein
MPEKKRRPNETLDQRLERVRAKLEKRVRSGVNRAKENLEHQLGSALDQLDDALGEDED